METIRIKRNENDFYRINIADDGTEIVFDLADIGLGARAIKAWDDAERNMSNVRAKLKVLENKKPQSQKEIDATEREMMKIYDDMFKENRKIFDEFFNCPGAMQKLFGDANYFDMYDDLAEAMAPHFERMNIGVDGIKERLAKKYNKTESNVLK